MRRLYEEMRKRDLLPFYDEITMPAKGGLRVQKIIAKAIVQSPIFVVILSHEFKGEKFPEAEADAALAFDEDSKKIPVFYGMTADKSGSSLNDVCRRLSSYIGYERKGREDLQFACDVADHVKCLVQSHSGSCELSSCACIM